MGEFKKELLVRTLLALSCDDYKIKDLVVYMKNILVCGVGNSKNLGDRLIAETVNLIIKKINNQYRITNFDFTMGSIDDLPKKPNIKLNSESLIKKFTPNTLRRFKVYSNYKKNTGLKIELKKRVMESDIVVIGGGQLLIDNCLNFPLGIKNVIDEAKRYNKPVIFTFVGGRAPWGERAKSLFLEALEYSSYISVRDSDTKAFLVSLDPGLNKKVIITSDPALFLNEMCSIKSNNNSKTQIGLGVMDPNEFKKSNDSFVSRKECARWWTSLAEKLVSYGYEVNIFTNGAPTDNGFVEYFLKTQLEKTKGVSIRKYPSNYEELIDVIYQQDLVVAQRLHACLPSISFMKHTFGIKWDIKVQSIFKELELEDYLINFKENTDEIAIAIHNKLQKSGNLDIKVSKNIQDKKREMLNFVKAGLGEEN
ncbi:polysaccharide pyruvyl transferase family protein [Oceanobacillus manasiensis]|uniref:polysaccharide pyruvyl transferase family protein n=1 Tax=Oceanobacillus manasiensis TaxID=586413 RepID=UPI0018DC17F3|nr:polysaccharide pyruvyl transferase family protein [Oceanobacillus manasiensis]